MNPALRSFSTSFLTCISTSGLKILAGCFTGLCIGSTDNLCVTSEGSRPGISSYVHANTSLLSHSTLITISLIPPVSSLEINTVRGSSGSSERFTSSSWLACSFGLSEGKFSASSLVSTTYTQGSGCLPVPPHRHKRYAFLPPGSRTRSTLPLFSSSSCFINGTPRGCGIILVSVKAVSSKRIASAK